MGFSVRERERVALAVLCAAVGAMASAARGDVFSDVPEAAGYRLAYSLQIPSTGFNYNTALQYAVNNTASLSGPIDRVAYYLTLSGSNSSGSPNGFVYVSFDAFTQDLSKIGVPTAASGAVWQTDVSRMDVVSNVAGVTNGTNLSGGNIEFWPSNYFGTNSNGVPNAAVGVSGSNSSPNFDWGDAHSSGAGFGSMQIANHNAKQMLLSFNDWGSNTGSADLGIGNNPGATYSGFLGGYNVDWTGAGNSNKYTVRTLQVLVHQGTPGLPAVSSTGFGILPLGDSITDGGGSTLAGGYRTGLATRLVADGHAFQYYGSQVLDSTSSSVASVLKTNDGLHAEGHSGYTISQITNNLTGSDPTTTSTNNGGYWLSGGDSVGRIAVNPQFILLHIGTNDIINNYGLHSNANTAMSDAELLPQMEQDLRTLVTSVTTLRPGSRLLLSNLIPAPNPFTTDSVTGHPDTDAHLQDEQLNHFVLLYNEFIEDTLVPEMQKEGRLVFFVDQYSNFIGSDGKIRFGNWSADDAATGTGLYADYGIHPNQAGYDKMGATWAAAIEQYQFAVVPEPSGAVVLVAGALVLRRRR